MGLPRSSAGEPRMEWRIDDRPIDYEAAVQLMDERAAAIREGRAGELVWLLEHPPLYTAGTSARPGVKFGAAAICRPRQRRCCRTSCPASQSDA